MAITKKITEKIRAKSEGDTLQSEFLLSLLNVEQEHRQTRRIMENYIDKIE